MELELQDFDSIVESIYDCAANPELWPQTLTLIKDQVDGAYALIGLVDQTTLLGGKANFTTRRNSTWDEEWLLMLEQRLSEIPGLGGGGIFNETDRAWSQLSSLPETQFHQTPFYQNWVKPQKLRDTINAPFIKRDKLVGVFSVPSYATREPYGAADMAFVESIAPHIRRAMMINDVTDKGRLALQIYQSVLDTLAAPVFVISAGGRIAFSNAAGDAMLSHDGYLKSVAGALTTSHSYAQENALPDAIARALKGDKTIGISGIGVPLIDKDGNRAAAYVLPIAGKDIRGSIGRGHCMVFIARRGEQQPVVIEILRTLYDLTQQEARVASLVALGQGPQAISDSLDLSISTVRTHLKHAYAKAEVPDLTALGALVNSLAPPLGT